MLVVPTQPIPNQTFQCQLNGQACTIDIQQYAFGIFVSLYVGNQMIVAGVLAHNAVLIVRSAYLGFIGDIEFLDTQGTADPVYNGLGSRYQLVYLAPADLAAIPLPAGVG
jgi:hypothetical protein